jgi:hypothetical protein
LCKELSRKASLDLHPFNAPIRLSAGLMLFNDNHASGTLRAASGSSFTLNGTMFFAGSGADSLTGSAVLGFHSIQPAPGA